MRRKRMLSRLWWGGLVVLAVLLAQVPIMAQEKNPDELAAIEAAAASQMLTIEQMKASFDSLWDMATEEIDSLEGKIDFLEGNIKALAEEFLKVTDDLQAQINSLTAANDDLQTQINSLTAANEGLKTQRLLLGLGFLAMTYVAGDASGWW